MHSALLEESLHQEFCTDTPWSLPGGAKLCADVGSHTVTDGAQCGWLGGAVVS